MNENEQAIGQNFKVTGNWELQAKQLKDRFPQLTPEDVRYETGKDAELLQRLGIRLNKDRGEVITIINEAHAPNV